MCVSPIFLDKGFRPFDPDFKDNSRCVPCGKCCECLKARSDSWTFRIKEELKRSSSAMFLTLTYENPPMSRNGLKSLKKEDFQGFMKRLRHRCPEELVYYACGEYGSKTYRPHYHAILFNAPKMMIYKSSIIESVWNLGHVYIAPCNANTIAYVTKYITKGVWSDRPLDLVDIDTGEIIRDDRKPERAWMSKHIGDGFLTDAMIKYLRRSLEGFVYLPGGFKVALPRYYREKVFSEDERRLMANAANEVRNMDFEKLFNSDYERRDEHRKNLIRRFEKVKQLERLKL